MCLNVALCLPHVSGSGQLLTGLRQQTGWLIFKMATVPFKTEMAV